MKKRRTQTSLIAVFCLCLLLVGSFLLARQGGLTAARQGSNEILHAQRAVRNAPTAEDDPVPDSSAAPTAAPPAETAATTAPADPTTAAPTETATAVPTETTTEAASETTTEALRFAAVFTANGAPFHSASGTAGQAVAFPADAPKKAGYDFAGWQLNGSTVTEAAFAAGDLTFTAAWTAHSGTKYTVLHLGQNPQGAGYAVPLASEEKSGTTDSASASAESLKKTFTGYAYDGTVTTVQTVNIDGDGNAKLYVYYSCKTFDILFADPSNAAYQQKKTLRFGADITPPDVLPVRAGHTLSGWEYNGNPPTNQLGILDSEGSRTYQAFWGLYQISFQYGLPGVENPAPFQGAPGAVIEFPANALTVNPGYEPDWEPDITTVAQNVTLMAVWDKRSDLTYQVHLYQESTAGGYTGVEPTKKTFTDGTFEQKFTAAQLAGTLPAGFSLDASKNPSDATGYVISSDENQVFSVYLKRNRHKLTFEYQIEQINKPDGTMVTIPLSSTDFIFGAPIEAPVMTAATGYEPYSAWSPALAANAVMPDKNVTFTCTSMLKHFKVYFYINGTRLAGTGPKTGTVDYKYGDSIDNAAKLPVYTPRTNYNFEPWDVSGTVKQDTHLYAKETVNYIVHIYAMDTAGNYSETPVTETCTDAVVGSRLTLTTPSIYNHAGFLVDINKPNKLSVATVPRPEEGTVELTVYYARCKFTLTTLTWGNKSAAKDYFFGQTIPAPAEPHTEDMTCTGWNPALPKTMPAENLTLVAQYRDKKLLSFLITGAPAQTTVAQTINISGIKLQCTYDNGSYAQKTVTVTTAMLNSGEVSYTPKSFKETGTQTVTVSFGGQKATFTISVAARLPQSISIKEPVLKPSFKVGAALDLAGYYVLVKYNNYTEQNYKMTDSKVKVTGYNKDKTGIQTLTVTYTEGKATPLKASFTINVVAASKVVKGDVNGDGYITSTDMTLVRKHYMKIALLKGDNLKAADVNGDGYVTSTDMTLIRKHYMKIQLIK